MRTLVTGAGGLLGRSAVPALEGAGHEVLGLTRKDADVTDYEALARSVRAFRPDWVIHLAGFTRVDDSETRADDAYLVNALGARNAALAAAASRAAVLLVSTDYIFDGTARTPYREYDTPGPRSVYGASKLAGERAVRAVHPHHMIVRSGWFFGPGGSNFVDTILGKARAGEALKVVDDQRGSPTLTADLADGLVRLVATGQFGTYHCTNSGDCTWYELAAHVLETAGLSTRLEPTDTGSLARPAPRPAYSVLGNRLFEHVTGNRMPHWREAVDRHLRGAADRARAAS